MKIKPNPYWICQIVGWSLFGASSIVMTKLVTGSFQTENLIATFFGTITFLALSHIGRNQFKKYDLYKKSFQKIILFLVFFVIAASTVGVTFVFFVLMLYEGTAEGLEARNYYMSYINAIFTFAGWASFYSVYKLFNNYKNKEINQWKLEAKVLETELKALIYQVNPHLLFNSLNNIRSLISSNPEKARDAITALSKLLRVSLKFNEEKLLPVQKELAITNDYINLEKLTHDERLKVNLDIAPVTQSYYVPALGIQTIVENAIKHGTPAGNGIVHVSIEVFEKNGKLNVKVVNPGKLDDSENKSGVGLMNLTKRLEMFGIRHQFTLRETRRGKVETLLIIEPNENNYSRRFQTGKARVDTTA